MVRRWGPRREDREGKKNIIGSVDSAETSRRPPLLKKQAARSDRDLLGWHWVGPSECGLKGQLCVQR